MDTAVAHHSGATMGIALDNILVSKPLEQRESLASSLFCLLRPQLLLDPSLHRGSVTH